MSLADFQKAVQNARFALERAAKYSAPLEIPSGSALVSFRLQQKDADMRAYFAAVTALSKAASKLFGIVDTETDEAVVRHIRDKVDKLRNSTDPAGTMAVLEQVSTLAAELRVPQRDTGISLRPPQLPADIREEVGADLEEIERCFRNGCLRSVVILCGRVLETALHRKYFEVCGQDLLEKAPGTGLGNLIAKMSEKGISIDPGLPNQIHLINQVRVFSVHKKQQPFRPSRAQAHAIMLYTLDAVEKLFAR